MSDEYIEGRWAFFHGYGEDENPYLEFIDRRGHADWQSGWYAAESGN